MNQNLNDDLEEGEIADDVTPEPVLEKKVKALPRRYTLNDRKNTPKHKKNCKHASQRHNRNYSKSNFSSNLKLPKKHRRVCPKHTGDWYGNVTDVFHLAHKKSVTMDLNSRKPPYDYQKPSTVKSAFKNFTSPPRKVSNLHNCHSSENIDDFPKLLSEYKNSRDELKFKNISNLKKKDKNPSKTPVEKSMTHTISKQESSENLPPSENSALNSDDEDEEELRRIALATCAKRLANEDITENNSCGTENSTANLNTFGSDNYEVVDMDIDEESESVENIDNLFVIDTTPTYFGELQQQTINNNFNYNLSSDLITTGPQSNGFIPSLGIEEPFQSFNGNTINHNLNNDLYLTNFSPILVNESNPPPSHVDDDFEEEMLRAELIANINSIRKKAEHCTIMENISDDKACIDNQIGIDIENKIHRNENFQSIRTINVKTERKENLFSERTVSIESKVSDTDHCFKERTVSIVNDSTKKENFFIDRTRNVSNLYAKHDVPKTINTTKRTGVDIKVKLNNVKPTNNANTTANKLILPQERIIISLNNESSSDDTDQEDVSQESPVKNSAVASLEALITNARHESDGKKESVASLNSPSDALSWLSKAQQEEYNSLMKILAKKQQTVIHPSQNEIKKTEAAAALTLLKKKMLIAKKNLEKEKELMNNTMKDLVKKKRAYMVAKLRTQHLKEQLLAAERVRKSNLQLWTKCSSELQTLKKSVSKRQAIINSLDSKITTMSADFDTNNVLPISNDTSDNNNLAL